MAQPGQYPSLNHLHGDLDNLGLVTRLAHPCRHDGGAVVLCGHLLIGAIDPRLVAALTPALRLSQTIWRVTPPKNVRALTWQPIQSARPCDQRASIYVQFEAPRVATKICAGRAAPVSGSVIGTV